MRIQMELYFCEWVDVDPCDLYDENMVSLADRLAEKSINPTELDGTYWYSWDLTMPPRQVRVI